jgi:Lrp/AsnC family transcriptional regulator, leucine-responsive regulatory protein
MNELTSNDHIILRLLQENAREKLETIAFETGLSVATIQRRIKYLKSSGVIIGDSALIAPESIGFMMTFLILVELERERIDQVDAFRRKINAEPYIQQCYYITGEADFALIALAKDIQDFESLTHRLLFDDSNVKRFRTSVVLNRAKVTLSVPLS